MILLSWIANVLNQAWHGQDIQISGVSIDGRSIKKGELFVAMRGTELDGHDYVKQAEDRGAVAALVSRPVKTELPLVLVENTEKALMLLGAEWRQKFSLPMVAVTGSCGKTSVRALIQGIFSQCGNTLASERSYNNSIGVPLTLLRLNEAHQFAVAEVGANHPGEIKQLIHLVKPSVAMITMAAMSHLAGFGNLNGIAKAKAEIFEGLDECGTGIINQDDFFAKYWRGLISPRKVISFGLQNKADIMADKIRYNEAVQPRFQLMTPKGNIDIELSLIGKHNVYNAVAATAAAIALDLPLLKIKQGLESVGPESRRLVRSRGYGNAMIIDDSYNANPASVKAAIEVLSNARGPSVLVLGDMLELGKEADVLHREIGEFAKKAGIKHLFCFGEHSKSAAHAFGDTGVHFSSQKDLVLALRPLLNADVTVLVKGSNSMGMHNVAQSLMQE